jgi:phosphoribosylformylglycinamidine cyclo-ligase
VRSKDEGMYARAGVDIDAADTAKQLIKQHARSTFRPEVLTDIGLFGGLFEFKGYKNPVLVSSADGVGTKLKIASLLDKHDTVGIDLVNHCINDILCCGAEPLFFLDYIAMGKLIPEKVGRIVSGLAYACKEAGCALIGGETAEMPGMYREDEYDLVGFIVGVVEKPDILEGKTIKEGDVILGLPSKGLHTNGYSLVRKIFDITTSPSPLNVVYPELGISLGEELLKPHQCYYTQVKPYITKIKALAHITGGGFTGNIPRVVPEGLDAHIDRTSWEVPAIFKLIQKHGKVEEEEMYRVFNMGIGMAVICAPEDVDSLLAGIAQVKIIGNIVKSRDS